MLVPLDLSTLTGTLLSLVSSSQACSTCDMLVLLSALQGAPFHTSVGNK